MTIIGQLKIAKPEPWVEQALCRETDIDVFYPEVGQNVTAHAAKKICALCTVQTDCLQYALANHERFGVWGGLSPGERSRLGWSA